MRGIIATNKACENFSSGRMHGRTARCEDAGPQRIQHASPATYLASTANGCSGLSDRLILLAAAAAHPDGPNNLAAHLQRNAAREDHHAALVRRVDSEELVARLAVLPEFLASRCQKPWP